MRHTTYINEEEVELNFVAKSEDNLTNFISLESYQGNNDIQEWANEYFHKGCSCSHDCCGHIFTTGIQVYTKIYPNEKEGWSGTYLVEINHAKNY